MVLCYFRTCGVFWSPRANVDQIRIDIIVERVYTYLTLLFKLTTALSVIGWGYLDGEVRR